MGVATDGNPSVGRHRAACAMLPARPPLLPSCTQGSETHLWNILSPGKYTPAPCSILLAQGEPLGLPQVPQERDAKKSASESASARGRERLVDRGSPSPAVPGREPSQTNGEQLTKE